MQSFKRQEYKNLKIFKVGFYKIKMNQHSIFPLSKKKDTQIRKRKTNTVALGGEIIVKNMFL